MTPTEDEVRAAIAQQAADWFILNQMESEAERHSAAFMGWLRTSPLHVEEYLRMASVSRDLAAAAADPDFSLDALMAEVGRENAPGTGTVAAGRLRPKGTVKPSWAWPWRVGAMATVAGLLLVALGLWSSGSRHDGDPEQRYATAHGEQRTWLLVDGSTLQLNTDSVVRVQFSRGERHLELIQGQAYFSVARDPQRRFRVSVGGADVIAVGTQFDLYHHDRTSVLTVIEGHVAVSGGPVPSTASDRPPVVSVTAGEQLRMLGSAVSGPPTRADLNQSESWRTGRLVFEQQPLGQVVAEFNRYAAVPIDVSDPALRALPISGAFDARDADSLISFLQATAEVRVTRDAQRITVARRSSGPSRHRGS